MNNTLTKIDALEDVKQQIFDIILTLSPQEQNDLIKSMRSMFVDYRYRKMKEAETEFKNKQDLFHDLAT